NNKVNNFFIFVCLFKFIIRYLGAKVIIKSITSVTDFDFMMNFIYIGGVKCIKNSGLHNKMEAILSPKHLQSY
ncbi:MAG: hypothetical protein Q8L90_09020, partial [Bacteroidota bacterium]|nr:hypothetical protein [Bacteroidota bacterium]